MSLISNRTGLPGVIPGYASGGGSTAIIDVFFWTPQGVLNHLVNRRKLNQTVVGGTGFIISSFILMIEVQKHWWLPNIIDIGWWGMSS